jgi:hypothetical protein
VPFLSSPRDHMISGPGYQPGRSRAEAFSLTVNSTADFAYVLARERPLSVPDVRSRRYIEQALGMPWTEDSRLVARQISSWRIFLCECHTLLL